MIAICSLSDKAAHRGTLYTSTWKRAGSVPNIDCLTPNYELVRDAKGWGIEGGPPREPLSDEEYAARYRKLLQARWPVVFAWLRMLDPHVDMTITCFCPKGANCHRLLIAKLIAHFRPDVPLEVN